MYLDYIMFRALYVQIFETGNKKVFGTLYVVCQPFKTDAHTQCELPTTTTGI